MFAFPDIYTTVSILIGFSMKKKEKILVTFGNRIREERLKLGISQEELAARAGVHRTYIGMIERAEKNITLINIERVAQALGFTVSELTNL